MTTCTKEPSGADLAYAHGQRWEKYIRAECAELARREWAFVSKNWEAPRVPGREIRREKSKPDFSGHLETSWAAIYPATAGTHIIFEAKSTLSHTSFPLSNIRPHQLTALERAHEAGAIAFVYLLDGCPEERKYVVPVPVIHRWISSERESIPFAELGICQKADGDTWLETWRRLCISGITRPDGSNNPNR